MIKHATTISEAELVSLLHKGDALALEYIYDRYSAALYGVVLKILRGKREVAEDVFQDSLTKVWLHRDQYDSSKATLFTWMLNICRNSAIDKVRSAEFRDSQLNQTDAENVGIVQAETLDTTVEHPTYSEWFDVRSMLQSLSAEQREIIDLMYFKGYTQAEIAEEFGIPLGTVKSRARLALESLRATYSYSSEQGNSSASSGSDSDNQRDVLLGFVLAIVSVLDT